MTINTKKFFDEKDPSTYNLSVKDTRFTPSMLDRQYTTTTGSLKKGNFEISSRMMGDQEVKDRLSKTYADMGMKMEGGGYLPNVGKKYVDTAAGIVGGIESLNKDGNSFDKVLMSQTGMNRSDAAFSINSQLEGTDAYHMQQVANAINLNVDQQRGVTTVIQPQVRTVTQPVNVPIPVKTSGKTNVVPVGVPVNDNSLARFIR